ncbi:hypothetical protein PBI_SCTP2_348 [Salicola phage SCTP-2]|nr:hypothetical protein PBI_SCTP2_348 [Salicola phage SCTP-2]
MLENERMKHTHNSITKMHTTLCLMHSEILEYDHYDHYDIVTIFTDQKQISKQSEILDECLESFFRTNYIISIMDTKSETLFHNEIPETFSDISLIYNEPITIYIADIFPDKKTFHLYKLQNYEIFEKRYKRYFN